MLSKRLIFIIDPGHGWLQVPLSEIVELGIEEKVSAYSFLDTQYAYLEEDCDASVYLAAREEQGHSHPVLVDRYVECFDREMATFPQSVPWWNQFRRPRARSYVADTPKGTGGG